MTYQVGDTVVHWLYGPGSIVEIDEKGLPGQSCSYYVIEGEGQTLWVPVNESGGSSLRLPTTGSEFKLLVNNILRSSSEKISRNPHQRRKQLDERMLIKTLKDTCLIIRDLTRRSSGRRLNRHDATILRRAEALLLDEWVRSLGIPRERAQNQMMWLLRDKPTGVFPKD